MDSSPKRYTSNFTNSTAQRGVEATEVEIANARLDVNRASTSSQLGADSTHDTHGTQDTGSYLQVVVEKHRRKQERAVAAVQTSARLARASSPAGGAGGAGGAGDAAGAVLWAAPVLVSRAADLHYSCARCGDVSWMEGKVPLRESASEGPAGREADARPLVSGKREKLKWNIFQDLCNEYNEGPERVEVFRFEHGSGAFLAASGGAPSPRCARAARRASHAAAAALARLLAVPRALLALPLALLLHAHRCTLETGREWAAGCALAASDLVLKPALAVTFNALVQPLLVFTQNVAQAARAALRPAALALGDALEPAARLLHAVRLVDVHIARPCACACAGPHDRRHTP